MGELDGGGDHRSDADVDMVEASRRKLPLWVACLVAAVVASLVIASIMLQGGGRRDAVSSPAASISTAPTIAPTDSAPEATDVLRLASAVGSLVRFGDGHMIFTAALINGSMSTLTLTGEVHLLGPDSQPMPDATAKLVEGWHDVDESAHEAALRMIAPRQHVTLVVTGSYNCRRDAAELDWPPEYPTVMIMLAGFKPWTGRFDEVFGISSPGNSFLTKACHLKN